MKKASCKIILLLIFCVVSALFLSCLASPDLEEFLKDENVQNKLFRDRVALIDHTGEGLLACNQRITGLSSGKYYRVVVSEKTENEESEEETDETPEITIKSGNWFVKEDGKLTEDLLDIGFVSGNAIIDLKNAAAGFSYIVYSASVITEETTLDETYTLDISQIINTDNSYAITAIPITAEDETPEVSYNVPVTDNIIELRETGTTDYLFIEYKDDNIISFKVLRITISDQDSHTDTQ